MVLSVPVSLHSIHISENINVISDDFGEISGLFCQDVANITRPAQHMCVCVMPDGVSPTNTLVVGASPSLM